MVDKACRNCIHLDYDSGFCTCTSPCVGYNKFVKFEGRRILSCEGCINKRLDDGCYLSEPTSCINNSKYESITEAEMKGLRIKTLKPSEDQIGGQHYKNLAIQPSEYIQKNKLTWCEGNVIKYVTRHKFKNGKEDIEKAIHYLNLLLEWYDSE